MADDPLAHVQPGMPLLEAVTADVLNELKRAARQIRAGRLPGFKAGVSTNEIQPSVTVLVANDSGGPLNEGAILRIDDKIGDPVNEPISYRKRPAFSGLTPDSRHNSILILSEPIASGDIGRAVILGIAVCDVKIDDDAHKFGYPISGDATKLRSGDDGPAIILWKETSYEEVKRCIVLVCCPALAGAQIDIDLITGVCPIFTGSTLTGVTVEKRRFHFPAGVTFDDVVCIDDPDDCCQTGYYSYGGDDLITTSCPVCPTTYSIWCVTFTGIDEDTLLPPCCDNLNSTWSLLLDTVSESPEFCTWQETRFPSGACGTIYEMTLAVPDSIVSGVLGVPTVALRLANLSQNYVVYTIPLADWECLGSNTLTKYSQTDFCTGWPDTIVVSPPPCGGGGGGSTGGCNQCASAPLIWVLTASGITGGTLETDCCNFLNGTTNLEYAAACGWNSANDNCTTPDGTIRWRLFFTGTTWQLVALSSLIVGNLATYILSGTFNCQGSNTFNLSAGSPACNNWPASVTITPG